MDRVKHPALALLRAVLKQACYAWNVKRSINKIRRPDGDIAEEWDSLVVSKASELLSGSVDKHAHWFALEHASTGRNSSAE